MQSQTNSGFVKTMRTKPLKTASKPAKEKSKGREWTRTDKRQKAN